VGTYRRDKNNQSKGWLILDGLFEQSKSKGFELSSILLGDWPAAYQLVGGVMAYQGGDG